jgi:hypothetical protein
MTWELEPVDVGAEPELARMIEKATPMTLGKLRRCHVMPHHPFPVWAGFASNLCA